MYSKIIKWAKIEILKKTDSEKFPVQLMFRLVLHPSLPFLPHKSACLGTGYQDQLLWISDVQQAVRCCLDVSKETALLISSCLHRL